jgi:hypothetical protein
MAGVEFPVDRIDVSTPGDSDKVVAIESWDEAGIDMVTVEFTDGEIENLPMPKAEARTKAQRCFAPDVITETTKNGIGRHRRSQVLRFVPLKRTDNAEVC